MLYESFTKVWGFYRELLRLRGLFRFICIWLVGRFLVVEKWRGRFIKEYGKRRIRWGRFRLRGEDGRRGVYIK
jgi:hypothetical protein